MDPRKRSRAQGEDSELDRGEVGSGLFLLIFGLVLLFWIIPAQIAQPQFTVSMSPRTLPQLCAITIIVLSAFLIVKAMLPRAADAKIRSRLRISRGEVAAVLGTVLVLVAACVVFSFGYFVAAACVLLWGALALLRTRTVLPYILLPVMLIAAAYVLLDVVMGTSLG